MRILVTGSREWPKEDAQVIYDVLWEINPLMGKNHHLIHGGARGVDQFACNVADIWGWTTHRFTPEWAAHGKAAGPMRNQRMVDTKPDVCVVFRKDGSRGATDCGERAESAGIRTIWVDYEDLDA